MFRLRSALRDKDRGFTLIELLVVIIIIGILAAIAIPVFLNQRKKALDTSLKSDLKRLALVMETYNIDNPDASDYGVDVATVKAAIGTTSPYAFKEGAGNSLVIKTVASTPLTGYCLRATNPNSNATATNLAFWYDSALGGLQSGPPSAFPAGGVCARSGTYVTLS